MDDEQKKNKMFTLCFTSMLLLDGAEDLFKKLKIISKGKRGSTIILTMLQFIGEVANMIEEEEVKEILPDELPIILRSYIEFYKKRKR